MRKSIYIRPTITIVSLSAERFLAASGIKSVSGADGLNFGGDTEEEGVVSGNVKGDSGWDNIWE